VDGAVVSLSEVHAFKFFAGDAVSTPVVDLVDIARLPKAPGKSLTIALLIVAK